MALRILPKATAGQVGSAYLSASPAEVRVERALQVEKPGKRQEPDYVRLLFEGRVKQEQRRIAPLYNSSAEKAACTLFAARQRRRREISTKATAG